MLVALATMTSAVVGPIVGSIFGNNGTLIGTGIGSLVLGLITALYEVAARKTHSGIKRIGPLAAVQVEPRPHVWSKIPQGLLTSRPFWITAGAAVAMVGATGYGFVALTEASTGQTLHGITTNSRDYGSSFGSSSTTPPAPAPSPTLTSTPTPTPSTVEATPSTTSAVTPTPSNTTIVPIPTVSTSEVSPSSSPDAQATAPTPAEPNSSLGRNRYTEK